MVITLSRAQGPASSSSFEPEEPGPHLSTMFEAQCSTVLHLNLHLSSGLYSLRFRFSDQNIVCIFHISHACHMPLPSHPSWVDCLVIFNHVSPHYVYSSLSIVTLSEYIPTVEVFALWRHVVVSEVYVASIFTAPQHGRPLFEIPPPWKPQNSQIQISAKGLSRHYKLSYFPEDITDERIIYFQFVQQYMNICPDFITTVPSYSGRVIIRS
jgi:hypothetical protein